METTPLPTRQLVGTDSPNGAALRAAVEARQGNSSTPTTEAEIGTVAQALANRVSPEIARAIVKLKLAEALIGELLKFTVRLPENVEQKSPRGISARDVITREDLSDPVKLAKKIDALLTKALSTESEDPEIAALARLVTKLQSRESVSDKAKVVRDILSTILKNNSQESALAPKTPPSPSIEKLREILIAVGFGEDLTAERLTDLLRSQANISDSAAKRIQQTLVTLNQDGAIASLMRVLTSIQDQLSEPQSETDKAFLAFISGFNSDLSSLFEQGGHTVDIQKVLVSASDRLQDEFLTSPSKDQGVQTKLSPPFERVAKQLEKLLVVLKDLPEATLQEEVKGRLLQELTKLNSLPNEPVTTADKILFQNGKALEALLKGKELTTEAPQQYRDVREALLNVITSSSSASDVGGASENVRPSSYVAIPTQESDARATLVRTLLKDPQIVKVLSLLRSTSDEDVAAAAPFERKIIAFAKALPELPKPTLGGEPLTRDRIQQTLREIRDVVRLDQVKSTLGAQSETITRVPLQLENLLQNQKLLNSFAPMMRVLGNPSTVLLPVLLDGFMGHMRLQIEPDNSYAAEDDGTVSEENRGKADSSGYKRLRFSIELPELGKIYLDIAYRGVEFIASALVASDKTCDFLTARIGMIEASLRQAGFTKISLAVRVGAPTLAQQVIG